jgi:hypothetical protein
VVCLISGRITKLQRAGKFDQHISAFTMGLKQNFLYILIARIINLCVKFKPVLTDNNMKY